jgi:hypothetical protein
VKKLLYVHLKILSKAFILSINSVETTDTVQATRNCVKIVDPEMRIQDCHRTNKVCGINIELMYFVKYEYTVKVSC